MNYLKIDEFDDKNGTGARTTIFVSGCPFKCEGCFNPKTWSYLSGEEFSNEVRNSLLENFEKNSNYLSGLSVLGGEPLAPRNFKEVLKLCVEFRERFPTKDIWLWSGYKLDEIQNSPAKDILKYVNTLIDGQFIKSLRDTELEFRGSSNQKVLRQGVDY